MKHLFQVNPAHLERWSVVSGKHSRGQNSWGLVAFLLVMLWTATGCTDSSGNGGVEETPARSNPTSTEELDYNKPSPGLDAPQDREHTAGRDNCPEVEKPLMALVPEFYLGLTTDAYPTFWYYIPYAATDIESATLVVWDVQQTKVSESTFPIEKAPGIVGIRLPQSSSQSPTQSSPQSPPQSSPASPSASASVLTVGERYEVSFSLTCNTESTISGGQPVVRTWVQRVEPGAELSRQLAAASTPRQRYVLYAANSLWHDALTELANQRRANPDRPEISADWHHLLSGPDVGLAAVASEELLP